MECKSSFFTNILLKFQKRFILYVIHVESKREKSEEKNNEKKDGKNGELETNLKTQEDYLM